jgi:ABC-type microcin C transport system permease subunit YejB
VCRFLGRQRVDHRGIADLYLAGKKVVSDDYLKQLTPLSLAVWYMDDGGFTLRAKGLQEVTVQYRHVARNAAIPVLTVLGLQVGVAISGSIVVETVFAWPGMGRLVMNSVFQRDYPVIQLVVMLIAASVVLINFTVDILYGLLDPRIRYE